MFQFLEFLNNWNFWKIGISTKLEFLENWNFWVWEHVEQLEQLILKILFFNYFSFNHNDNKNSIFVKSLFVVDFNVSHWKCWVNRREKQMIMKTLIVLLLIVARKLIESPFNILCVHDQDSYFKQLYLIKLKAWVLTYKH